MLVQCFLDRLAEGENVKFTPAAMKLLMQYDWPGTCASWRTASTAR